MEDLIFDKSVSRDSNEGLSHRSDLGFSVYMSVKDDKSVPHIKSPIKNNRSLEQRHASHTTLLSQQNSVHRKIGAREESQLLTMSL